MHCLYCNKVLVYLKKDRLKAKKFCSNHCQIRLTNQQYIERWRLGKERGYKKLGLLSQTVRKYLLEKFNFSCCECGWNERHPIDNRPLVEVDHIDGDHSNCSEENLRVLCPNCHSKTPTYRARNKGKGRAYRR